MDSDGDDLLVSAWRDHWRRCAVDARWHDHQSWTAAVSKHQILWCDAKPKCWWSQSHFILLFDGNTAESLDSNVNGEQVFVFTEGLVFITTEGEYVSNCAIQTMLAVTLLSRLRTPRWPWWRYCHRPWRWRLLMVTFLPHRPCSRITLSEVELIDGLQPTGNPGQWHNRYLHSGMTT